MKTLFNLSTKLRIMTDIIKFMIFSLFWEVVIGITNLTEVNLYRNIFNDSQIDFYI